VEFDLFANLADCYDEWIAREVGDGRFDKAASLVAAASPNSLIEWPGAPSPRGILSKQDTAFAAQQFQHVVLAGPQRRVPGLGRPIDEHQTDVRRKQPAALFLSGVRS
jgi:hypothetical protein